MSCCMLSEGFPKKFWKCVVSIFLTVQMLDIENWFQVKFSTSKFHILLRDQTSKFQTSSAAAISVLLKAGLKTAWPSFHSLFLLAVYKGHSCTSCASLSSSPSESPSAAFCLWVRIRGSRGLSEDSVAAGAPWQRDLDGNLPSGGQRHKEPLLVLTDMGSNKEMQWKRLGAAQRGERRQRLAF